MWYHSNGMFIHTPPILVNSDMFGAKDFLDLRRVLLISAHK